MNEVWGFLAGFKPVSPSGSYISILTWSVIPTPATIWGFFIRSFVCLFFFMSQQYPGTESLQD